MRVRRFAATMLAPRLPSLTELSHDWSRRQPTDHDVRNPVSQAPTETMLSASAASSTRTASFVRSTRGSDPTLTRSSPGPGPARAMWQVCRSARDRRRPASRPSRGAWGAGREPARARRPGRPLNVPPFAGPSTFARLHGVRPGPHPARLSLRPRLPPVPPELRDGNQILSAAVSWPSICITGPPFSGGFPGRPRGPP
jgi:hypothetical protein